MIYPVGNGTKKDFEEKWYIAQGFGNPTTYGLHEGVDLNLKTGGDTDLGQELKSIAQGRIIYYHYGSHPAKNFGRHLVYRIEGAWGVRWIHYAHCLDTGFLNAVQDVPEGKILAYLGKSGNSLSAHLHMSIFKVDPATIGGIDIFAHNSTELNQYWEDPIIFLNTWAIVVPIPAPPVTDQSKYDFGAGFGILELQQARSIIQAQKIDIENKRQKLSEGATSLRKLANDFES